MNQQNRNVIVDLDTFKLLVSSARSHVEDLEGGLEEGLYSAQENPDAANKRHALDASESLLDMLNVNEMPQHLSDAVAHAGELLIRAASVLGALSPTDQKRIRSLTESALHQGIQTALDATCAISPRTRESLTTHPPRGFIAL
jgi:hypothetical protein